VLHSELLLAARGEPLTSDYKHFATEVDAYAKAREQAQGMRVWRLVNDACVESEEIESLRKLAGNLPADLSPPDREAARRILEALASAWPRFEAAGLPQRKAGLARILERTVDRYYRPEVEERLMAALYERMGFAPIDKPLSVYFVAKSPFVGAWGEASGGYYVIVSASGINAPTVLDEMIHEVTHLIDMKQPAGSATVLARLRERLAEIDAEVADTFIHALVAWNAGELIRRHLHELHTPVVETAPYWKVRIRPWIPTFRGPWSDYLDGKLSRDAVVEKLAAALETP
jgi:hypothetical protein